MSNIVTSCQDCVFSVYKSNYQCGCRLGLLNKYVINNIAVEACNNDMKDRENFYILPNTLCIGKIPLLFAKDKLGIDVNGCLGEQNKQLNDLENDITKKLEIKWQAIIFWKDEDLLATLTSIKNQKIPPEHVTVIVEFDSQLPAQRAAKLLKNVGFKTWRVMIAENAELSRGNLIDIVLDKYTHPFYFVMRAGHCLGPDDLTEINNAINYKLISFGILKYKGIEIVATAVHKMFNGNSFGITLENKLIEAKCQNKIVTLE